MRYSIITILVVIAAITNTAAQGFEGTLTMIPGFKSDKPDEPIIINVKGDRIAMEPPAGKDGSVPGRMVGNRTTKEFYLLMENDGKKIAMRMDQMMKSNMGNTKGPKPKETQGGSNDSRMTGQTREIDGYTCQQMIGTNEDGEKTEAWITNELGMGTTDILFFPQPESSGEYGSVNGIVLEGWETDKKGKIQGSLKIRPEKKTLPDAMFDVPADYQKMDMMQMMQSGGADPETMEMMMKMFGGEKK